MKNFVQPGLTLTLTAPYDVAAGACALVGAIFGVAASAVVSGARGEFDTQGVFDLAKTTGAAWTEGAPIYWDNSGKKCTTTGTSNTLVGLALLDDVKGSMPASGDTVGRVKLLPGIGAALAAALAADA